MKLYVAIANTAHKEHTYRMVLGVIRSVQAAVKYRGGWRGLMEHMYTVSFKNFLYFLTTKHRGIYVLCIDMDDD